MCGYCLEQGLFELLELERRGEQEALHQMLGDGFDRLYLQETTDLPQALTRLRQATQQEAVVPLHMTSGEVLLCRLLGLLLHEGPASPGYRQLIDSKVVRSAIHQACNSGQPHHLPPGFELDDLSCLYQASTYLEPDKAAQLLQPARFKTTCHRLLKRYIQTWLQGADGLDYTSFMLLFRCLWFSLLVLGRYRASQRLLLRMVTTQPHQVPEFDGYDLWLQRQAALCLFRLYGLQPFCAHLSQLRPSLIRYLDLTVGFTRKERQHLRNLLPGLPQGDTHDDYCRLSEVLNNCF
jgi:hypothetical protein